MILLWMRNRTLHEVVDERRRFDAVGRHLTAGTTRRSRHAAVDSVSSARRAGTVCGLANVTRAPKPSWP